MIQQASLRETLRYRRPNLGDAHRARARLEREQRLVEGLRCGLGIGLGQGGPMQGLVGSPFLVKDYFPTAYAVMQADLGITEGTTLKATVGTGVVIAFTGTRSGPVVPIWVKATSTGARGVWNYAVYYDGTGTTAAMTGTSAATVVLTGAGTGLTINIATGTVTNGDTWKSTAATWNDQTTNAKHATMATVTRQPIIGIGYNGKASLIFDGVDDYLVTSVGSLIAAPGTLNTMVIVVGRLVAHSSGDNCFTSGDSFAGTIYESSTNVISTYNGTGGPTVALSALTLQRFAATFTNSASDVLKVGSSSSTGTNALNATGTNRTIGATNIPGQYLSGEILAVIWTPVVSYAAFDVDMNTARGWGVSAVAV